MPHHSTVYKVLISSPSDVAEERTAVRDVIEKWNATHAKQSGILLMPILWETSAAPISGDRPQAIINKQLVDDCDFMVAFFGSRIGTNTGRAASGTVEEIQEFERVGKPVLLYFFDGEVNLKSVDPEQLTKLREYQAKAFKDGLRWTYKSVAEFREILHGHLTTTVQNFPDYDAQRIQLETAIQNNPFLLEIVTRINQFQKLSTRCAENNPALKRAMAKHFWEHFFPEIVDKEIRGLFFESGSTIAYLSSEFRHKLQAEDGKDYRDEFVLRTNNILTYLQFILFESLNIALVPHGPPENTYGATFGKLAHLPKADPPSKVQIRVPLKENAAPLVLELAPELAPFEMPSLLLGTASGLELSPDSPFPGPHVGSYHNKLFKRSMLRSPHPMILFLDGSKICPPSESGRFRFDKCYPVCDDKEMWDEVRKTVPLAFFVGTADAQSLSQISDLFKGLDFNDYGLPHKAGGHEAALFCNVPFSERIGKRVDIR